MKSLFLSFAVLMTASVSFANEVEQAKSKVNSVLTQGFYQGANCDVNVVSVGENDFTVTVTEYRVDGIFVRQYRSETTGVGVIAGNGASLYTAEGDISYQFGIRGPFMSLRTTRAAAFVVQAGDDIYAGEKGIASCQTAR